MTLRIARACDLLHYPDQRLASKHEIYALFESVNLTIRNCNSKCLLKSIKVLEKGPSSIQNIKRLKVKKMKSNCIENISI